MSPSSPPSFVFSPIYDVVFKLIFANHEDLLASLLTAILRPPVPIAKVKVLNPQIPPPRRGLKGVVLDTLVSLQDGSLAMVEMQALDRGNLEQRSTFYSARVTSVALRSGHDYASIPRVVGVFLIDYVHFREQAGYHWTIRYHVDQLHRSWSDASVIHLVELPKAVDAGAEDWQQDERLLQWIQFLKVESRDDLQRVKGMSKEITKAATVLQRIIDDPEMRGIVDDHISAEFDHYSSLHAYEQRGLERGRREGRKEGLEQGRIEEKRAFVRRLATMGLEVDQIARAAQVSPKQVAQWLSEQED